jgi:tetratricopeptide (TPR) repeat protein
MKEVKEMKKYPYAVILIAIVTSAILATFFAFAQKNLDKKIEFRIGLDKETYLLREPIWLNLNVKNVGEEIINILPLEPSCLECLNVILVNSKGDTLRYYGAVVEHTKFPTGFPTEPGESRYNYISLLAGFGEMDDNFRLRYYLKPESYEAQAFYNGGVPSNKLKFKIELPKGDEKKAHDLLKEAYDYQIRKNLDKCIQKLHHIVNTYPKSVYADIAYYELGGNYGVKGDTKKSTEYREKLLVNYPNSYYVRFAFWDLLQGKSRDEQIQILKDILKKIPADTRAANWAQESLKTLEGKENQEK